MKGAAGGEGAAVADWGSVILVLRRFRESKASLRQWGHLLAVTAVALPTSDKTGLHVFLALLGEASTEDVAGVVLHHAEDQVEIITQTVLSL